MRNLFFLLNFFLCYITVAEGALASNKIESSSAEIEISHNLLIAQSNEDFYQPPSIEQYHFAPNKAEQVNISYQSGISILKFSLENINNDESTFYLYFNSITGLLRLYESSLTNMAFVGIGGTDYPILKREQKGNFGSIKIHLPKNTIKTFYLKINSRNNISSKLFVGTKAALLERESSQNQFLSFYTGGILLLVTYNLFLFILLKDKLYLLYSIYAISFLSVALVITGQFDQYLPNQSFTYSNFLICFSSFAIFSSALFTYFFIDIKRFFPREAIFYKIILATSFLLIVIGPLSFYDKHKVFLGTVIDLTIILGLIIFIQHSIRSFKNSINAKFYFYSWFFVISFVAIWYAATFGFLPINFITQNALPIGNMLEMLILSFALAYKIQILSEEKFKALEKAKEKDRYERLVRVLSHDIANSLTVVNSYARKLLKEDKLDQTIHTWSEKIFSASENIKNILQIVREQETSVSSKKLIDITPVNVLDCIMFSKVLYEEALLIKKIDLVITIPENLNVLVDRTCFINNILNNILSNAIKFSLPNSKIEISSIESKDFTQLLIRDYGVGINKKLIDDIFFSPKMVSSTGTNNERGHGIGCNLLREYMILFGGKLQVSSTTIEENGTSHGTLIKLIFPTES